MNRGNICLGKLKKRRVVYVFTCVLLEVIGKYKENIDRNPHKLDFDLFVNRIFGVANL